MPYFFGIPKTASLAFFMANAGSSPVATNYLVISVVRKHTVESSVSRVHL
jgi:hypothetical protein